MLENPPKSSIEVEISDSCTLFNFKKHPKLDAFLSIGNSPSVTIWDFRTQKCIQSLSGGEVQLIDAVISDNGVYVVMTNSDGFISIYQESQMISRFQINEFPTALCIKDLTVFIGTINGTSYKLDILTKDLKHNEVKADAWITQIAFYDQLYLMTNKIHTKEGINDIGHQGNIMHHHKSIDRLLTGDSNGEVIYSEWPSLIRIHMFKFGSPIVQVQIDENLMIGTFNQMYICNENQILQQIQRAGPFIFNEFVLVARSLKLTRTAYFDYYK